MIEAKIIADSVYNGDRLTTFQCTFPKFILGEVARHRVLSLSASSTRAIPLSKQITMVQEDPFIPSYWGKAQKGMSADEQIDDPTMAYTVWANAKDWACHWAKALDKIGVHKQTAGRLLEPFSWTECIISGTDWENFFTLRASPKAQPEMRELAEKMKWVYHESVPRECGEGEWHIPFDGDGDVETRLKRSTARCARASYKNHNGKIDIESDLRLHDQLLEDKHMNPFEHCAVALEGRHANFSGWKQYRKFLD